MNKQEITERILKCLGSGEKRTVEIKELIGIKPWQVDRCLRDLKESGRVTGGHGRYRLVESASPVEPVSEGIEVNLRTEQENKETINKMLRLYDKLLDAVAASIDSGDWKSIETKIETIKSLRWLGSTVDQLMKRWSLVHRGYDTSPKQAEADLKEKQQIADRSSEKAGLSEENVQVVAHWHPRMQKFFMGLPGMEAKEVSEEELKALDEEALNDKKVG